MRIYKNTVIYFLLSIGFITIIKADNTTGADFLKIVPSARSVGMNESSSAFYGDPASINNNPAGLSRVTNINISIMHFELIHEMDYEYFAYIQGIKNHVFGFSFLFFHIPDFIHFGSLGEDTGDINVYDIAVSFIYSKHFSYFDFGISGKYIHRVLERYKASAVGLNVGILKTINLLNLFKKAPENNLTLGIYLKDYGTDITFISMQDKLPTILCTGIKYTIIKCLDIAFQINKPISYDINNIYYIIGTELLLYNIINVRMGYRINDKQNNYAAGSGIKLKISRIEYQFDYSLRMTKSFANLYAISLSLII